MSTTNTPRKTISLAEMVTPVPFVRELLAADDRIRFRHGLSYSDIEEFFPLYVPHRDMIVMAFGLPKMEHQIAHMVEIAVERTTLPDWGMDGDPDRLGKTASFYCAALARETRVRAIQRHLFDKDDSSFYKSAKAIAGEGIWASTFMTGHLPFGRFKTMKDAEEWACDLGERTYKAWNRDRIKAEWDKRIEHLQHWMETPETGAPNNG
jgi:hypothetical protein